MLGTWVFGIDQVDILGAEYGCGADLGLSVGRNVFDLIGKQLQLYAYRFVSAFDADYLADLHTAQS